MQQVSDAWKAVQQKNILPISNIRLTYRLTNTDAEGSVSSAGSSSYLAQSNFVQVYTETTNFINFTNFGLNSWVLDGSCEYIPSSPTIGYVSGTLGNNDTTYTTNPDYILLFSQTITSSSMGTTIKFTENDYEYPTDFTVIYKLNSNAVKTISVTGNTSNLWTNNETINGGYNSVVITITKWNIPNTYARIEQLYLGINFVFEANNKLTKFEHQQNVDLCNFEISRSSITFEIDNSDDAYNPDNPTGIYSYISQKQRVVAEYGLKINGTFEYIKCGTFYMAEWDIPQNGITAKFTAKDLIYFMSLVDYDITKNFGQSFPISTNAKSFVLDAFTQAGIPNSLYNIDGGSFELVSLSFNTELGLTCADIVQLVGNLCYNTPIIQDRTGKIVTGLINSDPDTTYKISQFISYKNAEYNLDKQCAKVIFNDAGEYSLGQTGEVEKVYNPLFDSVVSYMGETPDVLANYTSARIAVFLANRKKVSGEFRPDVRLDVLDTINLENKYTKITGEDAPVIITNIKYTYDGGWKGTYEGRIMTNWV